MKEIRIFNNVYIRQRFSNDDNFMRVYFKKQFF